MWQDINGKTGYKNMRGLDYLYANLKLLNPKEIAGALADGIITLVKPVPKTEPTIKILERVKLIKINTVRRMFETESNKPVTVDGIMYNGGFESATRIDAVRRLTELNSGSDTIIYDTNNKPIPLNPVQVGALVIALGTRYQNLFAIKQKLIVNIRESKNLQAVEDIVIPWDIEELGV